MTNRFVAAVLAGYLTIASWGCAGVQKKEAPNQQTQTSATPIVENYTMSRAVEDQLLVKTAEQCVPGGRKTILRVLNNALYELAQKADALGNNNGRVESEEVCKVIPGLKGFLGLEGIICENKSDETVTSPDGKKVYHVSHDVMNYMLVQAAIGYFKCGSHDQMVQKVLVENPVFSEVLLSYLRKADTNGNHDISHEEWFGLKPD